MTTKLLKLAGTVPLGLGLGVLTNWLVTRLRLFCYDFTAEGGDRDRGEGTPKHASDAKWSGSGCGGRTAADPHNGALENNRRIWFVGAPTQPLVSVSVCSGSIATSELCM